MAASLVCLVFLCATHAVANGGARDEAATSLSLKSTITTRLTALEDEMKTVVRETIEDILRHLDELQSRQAAQTQKDEPQRTPTAAQTQKDEPQRTPTAAQTQKDEPQRTPTAAQKKPKFESYQRDAAPEGTEEQTKKEESQRKATKAPVTESKKVVAAGCGAPPPRGGTTVTQTKRKAVYKCKPKHRNIGGKRTSSVCDTASGQWSKVDIFCTNFTTCSMNVKGRGVYGGTVSTTKSGRTCQRWDQQKPNRHWFLTNESFKATTGLGRETRRDAANYCRDPGVMVANKRVWCYTTDPEVRSEECAVPECQVPK